MRDLTAIEKQAVLKLAGIAHHTTITHNHILADIRIVPDLAISPNNRRALDHRPGLDHRALPDKHVRPDVRRSIRRVVQAGAQVRLQIPLQLLQGIPGKLNSIEQRRVLALRQIKQIIRSEHPPKISPTHTLSKPAAAFATSRLLGTGQPHPASCFQTPRTLT